MLCPGWHAGCLHGGVTDYFLSRNKLPNHKVLFLVETDALILYMDEACRVSGEQDFLMPVFTTCIEAVPHFSFLQTVASYSEELFYYILQNEVLPWQGIRGYTKKHYNSLCFCRKIKKIIQYHCTYNWQNTITLAGV